MWYQAQKLISDYCEEKFRSISRVHTVSNACVCACARACGLQC